MAAPTIDDIDYLVGPATPHFAYQIRARVRALIRDLPEDHPVRRYGEEKIELLERLGHASSKAEEGPLEPRDRLGWEQLPSHGAAAAEATAEELRGHGAEPRLLRGNLGDPDKAREVVEQAGPVDVLVSNAATGV